MIATISRIDSDAGRVYAIVRRNHRDEIVDGHPIGLKRGDRIQVKRVTNNPFLVYVGTETK